MSWEGPAGALVDRRQRQGPRAHRIGDHVDAGDPPARAERATTQEITENRPPLAWAARGLDGPIRPGATIAVVPLDGGARSRGNSRAI
jgi:hypothetical protein